MSDDIGPGDWVQCLQTDAVEGDPNSVFAGRVYYCERIIYGEAEDDCPFCGKRPSGGLILTAVTPPGQGWCPCNFRPLRPGGATVERRDAVDA